MVMAQDVGSVMHERSVASAFRDMDMYTSYLAKGVGGVCNHTYPSVLIK